MHYGMYYYTMFESMVYLPPTPPDRKLFIAESADWFSQKWNVKGKVRSGGE